MSGLARRLALRSVVCFPPVAARLSKINHESFLTSADRFLGCVERAASFWHFPPHLSTAFSHFMGHLLRPVVVRSIILFARCRLATGLLTVQSDELFVWLALLPSFLPPKECQRKMGLWAKIRPYRLGGSHG